MYSVQFGFGCQRTYRKAQPKMVFPEGAILAPWMLRRSHSHIAPRVESCDRSSIRALLLSAQRPPAREKPLCASCRKRISSGACSRVLRKKQKPKKKPPTNGGDELHKELLCRVKSNSSIQGSVSAAIVCCAQYGRSILFRTLLIQSNADSEIRRGRLREEN
jgi:hypothetical protein